MKDGGHPAWLRTAVSGIVGVGTCAALWSSLGAVSALAAGWIALVVCYSLWILIALMPFDADQTQSHATSEDPGAQVTGVILTLASLASLAGVGALLTGAHQKSGIPVEAVLGVAVVVCSWVLVHLLFTVRYARCYYADDAKPAIDFGDDTPDYRDFAYLAFTLGMTYQVSDTNLRTKEIRRLALRHALLSYLLGAVVLACTINLVVQLAA